MRVCHSVAVAYRRCCAHRATSESGVTRSQGRLGCLRSRPLPAEPGARRPTKGLDPHARLACRPGLRRPGPARRAAGQGLLGVAADPGPKPPTGAGAQALQASELPLGARAAAVGNEGGGGGGAPAARVSEALAAFNSPELRDRSSGGAPIFGSRSELRRSPDLRVRSSDGAPISEKPEPGGASEAAATLQCLQRRQLTGVLLAACQVCFWHLACKHLCPSPTADIRTREARSASGSEFQGRSARRRPCSVPPPRPEAAPS